MIAKIKMNPTNKEIRQFGAIFLIGFLIIGAIMYHSGKILPAQRVWIMASAIGAWAIIFPGLAKPLYWLWMGIGVAIGSVMSRVVMALIFFLILTPLALFFRLKGRDALVRFKPKKPVDSYWTDHPVIKDKSYYDHLF
jgi:hypothetical protein